MVAQCDEEAIGAVPVGGRDVLVDHGNDAASLLAGRFRHQLLDPPPERRLVAGEEQGELVPAGAGRLAHHGPQPEAGVPVAWHAAMAGGGHRRRRLEELVEVDTEERRGHEPEERQRGVAAADVRGVEEDLAEAAAPADGFERRPRIGDRHELTAARGPWVEVVEVGERLDRAPRLGGRDEQGPWEVERALQGSDRVGVGGVEHREVERAGFHSEHPPEHVGRQARSSHAGQDGVGEAVRAYLVGEGAQLGDPVGHRLGQVEPSQPVRDLGGVRVPDGVVPAPDPPDEIGPFGVIEAFLHPLLERPRAAQRVDPSRGLGGSELGLDRREQLRQVGVEGREAVVQQPGGHLVEVDAVLGQERHVGDRGLESVEDGVGPDATVVAEGVEGGLGHRVHRVAPDERLDVVHVRVRGVLGPRRRPQRPLDPGTRPGEPLPAVAREHLAEALVGELGVGDGGSALQGRSLGQQRIDRRVDAGDEERRHGRDRVEWLPGGESSLETGQVGARHLFVHVDGEQQGDVDVDAGGGQFLDRVDRRARARHLDHDVGLADLLDQLVCGGDRPARVVSQRRLELEGHVAVDAGRVGVHRPEDVGRHADVVEGDLVEHLAGVTRPSGGETGDGLVVVGRPRDGATEDRGVRRHPGHRVVVQSVLEVPAREQASPEEVEPDALAGLPEQEERVHGSALVNAPAPRSPRSSSASARSAICSGVNPNASKRSAAESTNRSRSGQPGSLGSHFR